MSELATAALESRLLLTPLQKVAHFFSWGQTKINPAVSTKKLKSEDGHPIAIK